MHAGTDNLAFAPPPEPAAARAFVLAIIAHLLLMVALTWGINWQKEPDMAVAEAELWSRIPEQAAPPPAPPAVPQPAPPPPPPAVEKPAPPPPVTKEPDIAQEREKKRREEEARREREQEERKKLEAQKKKQQEEIAKREEAAREKAARDKAAREEAAREKAAEDRKREEQQAKAAKEKAAKDKAKRELEAKELAKMRDEQMRRIQGLAGTSGSPNATGTALRSKGPSASYAGRIAGRIKPNIVFTDVISGNPAAVVHLRVAPDGTIVGTRLVKSSGQKSWDDAVLRAIDKTATIPRDTDGSVVPEFEIEFRPRD